MSSKVRVEDIARKIAIGPFGSRMKSDRYVSKGVPVIRGTNITGGKELSGDWVFVSEETADSLENCCVYAGDLVFPHRGSIGEVGIVSEGFPRYVMSSSLMKLSCDRTKADPAYVYYFFKSAEGRYELLKNASQVGTPGIGQPLASLKSIEIPLPALEEQKAIVKILSALDEKITLNHQTSLTLERMSQAIFKSWFVDFDPVRAKMDGREPEGMDAATAALFPNELVESEFGLIPKGWEMATLKQLTSKIGSGATPKGGREVYLDEGIALIRSQNVYDSLFVWDGLARISDDAAAQLKGVEVFPEDVLLNITGASILRTCVVTQEVLPARVNQHVSIVRAKDGVSSRYLHLHLLRRQVKEYLLSLNAGGSREAVTKSHIESVPILNPGRDLLLMFHQALEPLFSEIEQLAGQGGVLSELRDTLLPKLLSGDLKVKEV